MNKNVLLVFFIFIISALIPYIIMIITERKDNV